MNDFPAAVDAFRDALARFDAPPAPEQPRTARLVDAGQLLEQMAIERETAMAASTSKARQAARPVESLAPRPYRRHAPTVQCTSVEDALRRLGKGTEREIGAAAGVSHNTVAERLRRMERDGTARRAGGGDIGGTGGGRVPLTWEAAEGPREVEMPKGKRTTDDEILAALKRSGGEACTAHLALSLGLTEQSVNARMRKLAKAGKVSGYRGKGMGAPRTWRLPGKLLPEAGPMPRVSAKVKIVGQGIEAAAKAPAPAVAFPPLRFAPLSQIDKGPGAKAPFAVVGVGIPLAAELGRLAEAIERAAKRRAAVSLRAEADRLDAEAAAGG
jgi:predicted ArsR family transcriptional regulator